MPVTISASCQGHQFNSGTSATMYDPWENPCEWSIHRVDMPAQPNDPRWILEYQNNRMATFSTTDRPINATYILQLRSPFDSLNQIEVPITDTPTTQYKNARFTRQYNQFNVVDGAGDPVSTDVYIGPPSIATVNDILRLGTKCGTEWNTGQYSFPLMQNLGRSFNVFWYDAAVQTWWLNDLSSTFGVWGAWTLPVTASRRRSYVMPDTAPIKEREIAATGIRADTNELTLLC